MAKLKYSDEELIKLYRGAADKNKQIEILSDMKCCKPQEIIEMLADAGEIPGMKGKVKGKSEEGRSDNPSSVSFADTFSTREKAMIASGTAKKMKAPRWTSDELEQVQNLIDEGMSYSEIADRFGRNKQSICDAVSKHGLKGARKMQDVLPEEKKEVKGKSEEGRSDNPSSVSFADTFSTREKAMEEQSDEVVGSRMLKHRCEDADMILSVVGDYIRILGMGLQDVCENFCETQDALIKTMSSLLSDARLVLKEVYDD